jgi:hypothetical protein
VKIRVRRVTQVAEHLPSKYEALSSNPEPRERERERESRGESKKLKA